MFPVGDFLRRRTTPYVNWTLIAINVAVFVYTLTLNRTVVVDVIGNLELTQADRFLFEWGFQPACVAEFFGVRTDVPRNVLRAACPEGDREAYQVFTSMFVHAGWAHIASNMLFLWIFGDNVEDQMGHGRYLVFYLLCGLAAAAAQTFMAIGTLVPAVGASGAIAGILGAYLMLFPTVRVQVVIFPLFFVPFFVPAVVLIGFWFLTQLFSGLAEIGDTTAGSGVAWWAHIGGFIAGAVLIWLFRQRQPRRIREYRVWDDD